MAQKSKGPHLAKTWARAGLFLVILLRLAGCCTRRSRAAAPAHVLKPSSVARAADFVCAPQSAQRKTPAESAKKRCASRGALLAALTCPLSAALASSRSAKVCSTSVAAMRNAATYSSARFAWSNFVLASTTRQGGGAASSAPAFAQWSASSLSSQSLRSVGDRLAFSPSFLWALTLAM